MKYILRNMDNRSICEATDFEMCDHSDYDPASRKQEEVKPLAITSNGALDTFPGVRHENNVTASQLPNELWLQIFSYLSHGDLLQVKLVCKDWRQLTSAAALNRKSVLVIGTQNLKDIYDYIEHEELKYGSVLIDDSWGDFDYVDRVLLFQIFKQLGPNVVQLKLHDLSSLSILNNPLPKLEELDLYDLCSDTRADSYFEYFLPIFNCTKFPRLKSLLMPCYWPSEIQHHVLSDLTRAPTIRLERLNLEGYYFADNLNVIATHASSLRWLSLNYCMTEGDIIPQNRLKEIFSKCTRLEVLDFRHVCSQQFTKIALESLPKETRLKTIILDGFCSNNDLLKLIVKFSELNKSKQNSYKLIHVWPPLPVEEGTS
uniref:F-box domain-containing protein n=1 Tax=Glossina morsitans morsitans TaxID=37546 RepID=A0A1B0FHT4_GLOMM